ncbi:MAG: YcjF family protein [Candidatus Nanopelagicales bacterium]
MAQDFGKAELGKLFTEKHAEAVRELGRFNLAVFGKTGAGKSTLINAVFGQQVAATGTGAPVTTGLEYYEHPGGILGLYDSQGFETGHAGDAVLQGLEQIVNDSRAQPIERQIHAAWYLVRWSDRRFESAQAEFVRRLSELVPVVFVLSQVPMAADGRVHQDAIALARYIESYQLPISPWNSVVLTNALPDDFLKTVVFGLDTLLDATFATAPEATRRALIAAQLVNKERKRQAATTIVKAAASSAVATGITPIPFSDAAILIPLQIAMIARITAIYGLTVPASRMAALVGSLMLSSGATTAGRWLVGSILRMTPGGQIPAMAISGVVAGTLTSAIGRAWIEVCDRMLEHDAAGSPMDTDALQELFRQEFKRRFRADRS